MYLVLVYYIFYPLLKLMWKYENWSGVFEFLKVICGSEKKNPWLNSLFETKAGSQMEDKKLQPSGL